MDSIVHARYLDVRLFLEGNEVDVTSVKTSCGVNVGGQATLTIPAVDAAHKFLPRTLVHVFYFDSRHELGTANRVTDPLEQGPTAFPGAAYRGEDSAKRVYGQQYSSPETYKKNTEAGIAALLTDKDDWRNWKLLFVGEVIGYSFRKVGGRREIILACQDHSSYWDNCRLYWGQKRAGVFNAYKTSTFSGATQLYRGKSKVDSSGDLLKLLNRKPSSMPSVPGLMGGIFSVMESVTGVFMPGKSRFRGTNDFISQAEIRLKLTRQVGASAKDDTSSTFTNSKSFKRYLVKWSKSVIYTATLTKFTTMLCSKIYHDSNSQLAPPYFAEGDLVEGEYLLVGKNLLKGNTSISAFGKAIKITYDETNRANFTALKRRGSITKGPEGQSFKIPLDRDYVLWHENGSVDVAAHKKYDKMNTDSGILSAKMGGGAVVSKIDDDPLRDKGVKIKEVLDTKANKITDKRKRRSLRNQASHILKAYHHAGLARMRAAEIKAAQVGGPNYDQAASTKKILGDAKALKHNHINYEYIRRELEIATSHLAKATGRSFQIMKKKVELNDRLYTTYFHPDLYMCPPPKCNVLFPDSIQSITFSRNWMSEISRLWLHGKTESGRNKKDCYFSPNGLMLNGATSNDCAQAVRCGAGFVMRHEKYTGIIPSFMGLGDNDTLKKLHKRGLRKAKKEYQEEHGSLAGFDSSTVSGEAKFSPQPHLQRAANYIFFSRRYQTRTMQVTCKYSPQLVAGMPALVLDPVRQKSRISIGTDSVSNSWTKPVGTHYIGTIAELVHIIDISGGAQTEVTLVKCREHTEGAALFGNPDEEGNIEAVRTKTRSGRTLVKPPKGKIHKAAIVKRGVSKGGEKNKDGSRKSLDEKALVTDTHPSAASRILGRQYKRGHRYRIEVKKDPRTGVPLDAKTGNPLKLAASTTTSSSETTSSDAAPVYTAGMSGAKYLATVKEKEAEEAREAEKAKSADLGEVVVNVFRYYTKKELKDVHFTWEASVMPPWFSSIYSPLKIGTEYYSQMYGCTSVLDTPPVTFKPGPTTVTEYYNPEKVTDDNKLGLETVETRDDMTKGVDLEGMETVSVPFKKSGKGDAEYVQVTIPVELTQRAATTESAADNLAETWLALKEIGAQTDLFIDGYVNRKYATLLDVMGNQNPALTLKTYDPSAQTFDQKGLRRKVQGFHGDAYGPYLELKDWNGNDLVPLTLPAFREGVQPSPRKLNTSIDPRYVRYNRVREYIDALRSHGYRSEGAGYTPERDDVGDFNEPSSPKYGSSDTMIG